MATAALVFLLLIASHLVHAASKEEMEKLRYDFADKVEPMLLHHSPTHARECFYLRPAEFNDFARLLIEIHEVGENDSKEHLHRAHAHLMHVHDKYAFRHVNRPGDINQVFSESHFYKACLVKENHAALLRVMAYCAELLKQFEDTMVDEIYGNETDETPSKPARTEL